VYASTLNKGSSGYAPEAENLSPPYSGSYNRSGDVQNVVFDAMGEKTAFLELFTEVLIFEPEVIESKAN